jgi:hypothetical protein
MGADPKSIKYTNDLNVFFTLSGSSCAKAVHRTLVKLTPTSVKAARKRLGEIEHVFLERTH